METPTPGRRIYLDYAASTPLDEEVREKMEPYFSIHFGNPGGLYEEGRIAKEAVESARASVATSLSAHAREIIFTSGGTESNALGILGLLSYLEHSEKRALGNMHIITSAIEHPSAFAVCKELASRGAQVSFIGVSEKGILNLNELKEALQHNTMLVSVMYANNEIGTIQPIKEVARIIKEHRKKNNTVFPYFHIDASQVPSYLDVRVEPLGVDLMTLDAQKIYGPKGIGVLYKRTNTPLLPLFPGGKQERGFRTGTENVPLIVGMAESLRLAIEKREHEVARLSELRDYFVKEVLEKIPGTALNGDSAQRIANNANFYIPGVDNEWLVMLLDARGIAIGSKSACQPAEVKNSHVVLALGKDVAHAKSSFRFTMGRKTKKEDLDYVVQIMSEVVSQAQHKVEEREAVV
ncbi:MAG: cysteine desulfurase family protein [Candidatus Paceibacterota bacterium]